MAIVASIASSKGGCGKSVTAMNLGVALAQLGRRVTVVDGNVSNPNLSMYLGVPKVPTTLHHILKKGSHIKEATYSHDSGIQIVPGSIALEESEGTTIETLKKHLEQIDADIVLLDSAPGTQHDARETIKVAKEVLIITNPELPSVADALKTVKLAERYQVPVRGVIVTRSSKQNDMTIENIEVMLNYPVLAVVPEDHHVKKALLKKEPLVHVYPEAPAATAYKRLAHELTGNIFKPQRKGFFSRTMQWLLGK